MEENKEKKSLIIAAARVRFSHYGFNKTTMAEIAADCQMSAANIYRYFPGKKELLAQIALEFFNEVEEDIRQKTAKGTLSPVDKVLTLVLTSLNKSHEQYAMVPKINEALEVICSERCDLIGAHRAVKGEILAGILEAGVASGFFKPHDCAERAEIILNGTVLVHPVFLSMYDIDYLRMSLGKIVNSLTEGLLAHG